MKNILRTLLFATTIIIWFAITSTAQNTFPSTGAAGIGTTTPNASSLLEVKSTSKGVLFPRMTQTQRNAIASPVEGLLIYQTDHNAGFYYYSGTAWTAVTAKKGWSLTGNSGTSPGTDFIGTTDAQPLVFKVNNLQAGYLDYSGLENTGFGYQSLIANTSGYDNTAVGYLSLFHNTTGGNNTGVGDATLVANTTGSNNTAVGSGALYINTTGVNNTATGSGALYLNGIGSYNTANGSGALYSNLDGVSNTAVGYYALSANTSGYQNTALGNNALNSNTTGSYNLASGVEALSNNSTGFNNAATGQRSLYSNTTGGSNTATGMNALYLNTTGSENVGNGYQSLYSGTTAWENTANGYQALFSTTTSGGNTANGSHSLYYNTTGSANAANGSYSLYSNTTGIQNTADGNNALYYNTTGSYNIGLGENSGPGSGNGAVSNYIGIGYFVGGTSAVSNRIDIGNGSVIWIGGQVGWSTYSDGRIKENIHEDIPGLAFINKLRPVSYNINLHKENEMMYNGTKKEPGEWPEKYDIEKTRFTGFIAQEVEKAASDVKYDFSGVVRPTNENDLYSLRYSDFVVPLVKAVQQLSAQNDSLKSRITKLEATQASTGNSTSPNSNDGFAKISSDLSSTITLLGQNIPNPFDNSTLIPFRIPKDCHDASIMVVNTSSSEVVNVIPISCNEDHVSIDVGTLSSGSYSYSLYVNGKMVDTKSMELLK